MFEQSKMSASELVTALQNKSEEAFSVLYYDYAPALFGVALRILNNQTIAEDLLQDAFVKIWKHIDTYDPDKGTLFTWMLNITRNTCKDHFRSKQYKYKTLTAQDELESIPSQYIPQTTHIRGGNYEVEIITQQLEPKYKEIIDLIYIQGYSQLEVSLKLDIPLGTVKTRSRAALMQLRCSHPLPI